MGNLLKRALLLLAIVIAGMVPAWGQCNPTIQTCVNLATDTTGTLPVASLPASVVQTTGDATFGAHTYDFSGVTLIKLKIGAGYTTTTSGVIGYDSSANLWRFGQNGVAITLPQAAGAISHQWLISYTPGTGAFTQGQPSFTDIAGVLGSGQCPNPGASSLGCTQSLAVVSHNFLTGISTSGVVTQAQPAYSDISGTPTLYNQTIVDGAGTTATQQPIFKFINGTNMTIVCVNNGGATRTDCTFTSSATAATAFSSLTASTNSNAGNFIVSGGNWDFSGGTWKAPIGAAYAPTASGVFGYDSTANGYVFGQNGATIRYSLSSSACSTHQFVNVPATNAATAICAQPAYSDISGTPTLYNQTIDANGTSKPQEPILNLISGSGATVSCADNPGATRTDCTVAATGTGTVTPTGSPASPNLTCFSGATSITNCNLSGDATTSGAAVVTVAKVNGVTYPTDSSTNTVPVKTASGAVTYEAVPNAALANSSVSINSVTATLGANCTTCAANLALGNLSSVGVNLALTPATDNSIALDSLTKRYTNAWFSGVMGWTNGSGAADTGLSRDSADVVDVGNGTAGDHTAIVQAGSFVEGSAAPTACSGFFSCQAFGEQITSPTPVTGTDIAWSNYSNHYLSLSNNGTPFYPITRTVGAPPLNYVAMFSGNDVQSSGIPANQVLSTQGIAVATASGALPAPVQIGWLVCNNTSACSSTYATVVAPATTTLYNISAAIACTTSTASATATLTVQYTDPSSIVQTIAPGAATCTTLGSSSIAQINQQVLISSGTNVQYKVVTANSPVYTTRISISQEGLN